MEPAAKDKWEARVSELIKCPLKNCGYSFTSPKMYAPAIKKYVEDRLYAHLYKYHRKPEIITGILILAGLKEDLEENF